MIHNHGGADGLDLEFRGSGKFEKILYDGIHMTDFFRDDIKIFFLGVTELQRTVQAEKTHFHRGKRVADAVGHAGGKFAHQSHFIRLQKGFTAFLKLGLGMVHILNQASNAVAERFDLIARQDHILLTADLSRQSAKRSQNLGSQNKCQENGQKKAYDTRLLWQQS